jgi:uncharacterized protein YndB with AHSA1/START domain
MDNFKKTIILQAADVEKVFDALTNSVNKWWTEMFEGISNQEGQTFTIRFGANVFKTMLVEEIVPNQKVIWHVTDSLIDIPDLQNKTEWINTKIVWEMSSLSGQTFLHLTHFGLTPQVECYTICESGWHSFTDSLSEFIITGVGKPFSLNP